MAATAVVQTRIDPVIRDRAAEVLDGIGMTVSDAVRILLTRVAKEGALPAGLTVNAAEHDAWFRGEVEKALRQAADPAAKWVPNEEVAAGWRKQRAELVKRAGKRRGETFLLLREAQFERIVEEAADPPPKSLADLLVDYDADDVRSRLSGWSADAPAGKEVL